MLNALEPGTHLPIHRHRESSETVVILRGRARYMVILECKDGAYEPTGPEDILFV